MIYSYPSFAITDNFHPRHWDRYSVEEYIYRTLYKDPAALYFGPHAHKPHDWVKKSQYGTVISKLKIKHRAIQDVLVWLSDGAERNWYYFYTSPYVVRKRWLMTIIVARSGLWINSEEFVAYNRPHDIVVEYIHRLFRVRDGKLEVRETPDGMWRFPKDSKVARIFTLADEYIQSLQEV